jgi:hypothetical protein
MAERVNAWSGPNAAHFHKNETEILARGRGGGQEKIGPPGPEQQQRRSEEQYDALLRPFKIRKISERHRNATRRPSKNEEKLK